jgi:hypothetical protein
VPHKKPRLSTKSKNGPAESAEELQERAELVKKKLEQRKANKKSNPVAKSERKRLKLEKLEKIQKLKGFKKILVKQTVVAHQESESKVKQDPDVSTAKVFNKEGKLFFSKVETEGESGKSKKKKKGQDTNPKANLQKLKSQKKKIRELIDSGELVLCFELITC